MPKKKPAPAPASQLRNRVVERRRMRAAELLANPRNWRDRPPAQASALRGVLHEVGQVGELYAYRSARNGGALTLIDGHLRADLDPAQEWDVAVTDLSDEEADKVLLSRDPIAALAGQGREALDSLLADVRTESDGLAALFAGLRAAPEGEVEEAEVKPPPKVVWLLVAVPLDAWGEVQPHVAALQDNAIVSVQSSRDG